MSSRGRPAGSPAGRSALPGRAAEGRDIDGLPATRWASAARDAEAKPDLNTDDLVDGAIGERNPRIAAAHRLLRRSRRVEVGEFLAEGAQAVSEAIRYAGEVPGSVLELYITAEAGEKNVDLVRAAFAAGIEVTQVTKRAASFLSDTQTPQGIIARCRMLGVPLEKALAADDVTSVAVLVNANDPGNAGTVVRLADASGADLVIFAGESVDAFNPKAVRASAGSVFHLPLVRHTDLDEVLAMLSAAGLNVVATTGGAELDLDTATDDGLLDLPTAWLFGSEAHGLPQAVIEAADVAIKVPIHGKAESLNLATAAAVCLYATAGAHRRARR